MPRHNLKKYTPVSDSSAGYKTNAAEEKAVVLSSKRRSYNAEQGGCPCGCEGEPKNPKRIFVMGHDARLRGILIRAHLTQTPIVRFVDGVRQNPVTAMADAERFGPSFVDALTAAEERVERQNKKLLHSAMNSKRLVKVGRWEYTGQVAAVFSTPKGDEYEIRYVTKTGETKTTRVPAEKAPLAA